MANLQYVGPRVVPKPYRNPDTGNAEWKSGIEYEALTMVTYLSNGYVSALPVPSSVGNPADNPDYWVESADFDAALSDLQTRVHDLELQNGNETLHTTAQTLSGAVNEIIGMIDRKYLLIGDSYSITYSSVEGWMSKLKTILGLDNTNCFMYGHSGYGFIGQQDTDQPFSTLLSNAYNDLGSATAATITDVVVLGGRNDVMNTATPAEIKTAIQNFVNQCATQFPNARLYIGMCGMYTGNDTATYTKLYNLDHLYYMSKGKNLIYIKGLQHIARMAKNLMNGDSHPNDAGNERLAANVASVLKGGNINVASEFALGITLTAAESHTNTGNVYYIQKDNGDIELLANLTVGVSDMTVVKENAYPLVVLSDAPFKGLGINTNYRHNVNVRVRYTGSGGQSYKVLPAQLVMLAGTVYLYFYEEFDYYNTIDYIMFAGVFSMPYKTI